MPHHADPGPIAIIGAGGFGRECLDIVDALNELGGRLGFVGFADDGDVDPAFIEARNTAVISGVAGIGSHSTRAVIAIGSGSVRQSIDTKLGPTMTWAVLVHPQATLGSCCEAGDGTILNAGARVTTNVALGRHVQVHANATVGHDAQLGDFVSIFPGATVGGGARIGRAATVGASACVLPGITIGADAFVGAGAVVTNDVVPGATVVGVPARSLPTRRDAH